MVLETINPACWSAFFETYIRDLTHQHPLHPDTRRALTEARKAILLLNRRGWSNFLTCRTCGKVWECPQCDVALVLHRAQGAIACHHCGHREPVPQRCDACGSPSVARYGAGTERLEAELADALDVPVFRLDADTAGANFAIFDRMRAPCISAMPGGNSIGPLKIVCSCVGIRGGVDVSRPTSEPSAICFHSSSVGPS